MATVTHAQPATVVQQPVQFAPAQTFAQVPGQPIVAVRPRVDPRLKHKETIFRLGVTEIVIGSICILLTIVPLSITTSELEKYFDAQFTWYGQGRYRINTGFTNTAAGIWSGIFNIITGILAVRLRNNPSKCNYIANMILSICTANVTLTAAVLSGIAAGMSYFSGVLIAIQAVISVLNIASMIITIVHASLCCGGACYNEIAGMNQQVVYVPAQANTAYPQQQLQYVQAPNGQLVLAATQPVAVQGYPQAYPGQSVPPLAPGYYPPPQMTQPTLPLEQQPSVPLQTGQTF